MGTTETWKDIKGYEGFYQISNYGNVKSLKRLLMRSNNKIHTVKEIILKENIEKKGYVSVKLNIYKKSKIFKIHRLVAESFIPNPNNYPQINHKDGNKKNNKVDNLEWVTCSQNLKHAFRIGLKKARIQTMEELENFREMAKSRVINIKQYDKQNNFIADWNSAREAERKLGINNSNITAVCKNKKKYAGGFIWKYL